jgi:hypothetical protein
LKRVCPLRKLGTSSKTVWNREAGPSALNTGTGGASVLSVDMETAVLLWFIIHTCSARVATCRRDRDLDVLVLSNCRN